MVTKLSVKSPKLTWKFVDVDEELYGVFPSVLIKEQFNVGEAAAREK